MQRIKILLILCSLSFTASSQTTNDSIVCFTQSQVKTFLITKVELNNCLEQYAAVSTELKNSETRNAELVENEEKLERKVKRNRGFAIAGGAGFVAVLVLLFAVK